ncbi:MAG: DUF3566 domain-containing protein [Anaerolineae bacterium]|jgi:hypothetical protein|nr:DUF3566 domain-containing protein [Anaerolineae bacterium]
MVTVKRIHVASAFRVGALVFGILFAIVGFCYTMIVVPALSSPQFARQLGLEDAGSISPLNFLITFVVCGVPLYAAIGGVFGALFALIYNRVAQWVGGLEIELERQVMLSYSDPLAKPLNTDEPFGDIKGKDIP